MADACLFPVKSFGDFVIAKIAADRVRVSDRQRLAIACATHLEKLCAAIQPQVAVVPLRTKEDGVPSLFDVRNNGVRSAVVSAFQLRRAVADAPIASDTVMIADRVHAREWFVLGNRPTQAIAPDARNIYSGYAAVLEAQGFLPAVRAVPEALRGRLIGLFPGSRLAKKNLPETLLRKVTMLAREAGWETKLFVLADERPDLEASNLPVQVVPRSFAAMRDAVAACDVVVSADSLPAHLAEMVDRTVFVFTPEPNEFWMPASAWQHRRWSLFDNPAGMRQLTALLSG